MCTTSAIESVNARIRRAVKARGHFPNEAAALKCVYMAIMSLDRAWTRPVQSWLSPDVVPILGVAGVGGGQQLGDPG